MEEQVLKHLEFEATKFKHANKLTDKETACFIDGYKKALEILLELQEVKNNSGLDDVINKLCDCLMPSLDSHIFDRCSRCNGYLIEYKERSELLKKWWNWFDKECVAVNCNEEEREEVISRFFNCL